MIVDTSVMRAMLLREPEADASRAALLVPARPVMAAPTLVELRIEDAGIEVVPFTAEHARIARDGWRRFGKGRPPAALNLGDCVAYALAKASGEPLLFKGDDFSCTNVLPVLPLHG